MALKSAVSKFLNLNKNGLFCKARMFTPVCGTQKRNHGSFYPIDDVVFGLDEDEQQVYPKHRLTIKNVFVNMKSTVCENLYLKYD